ncbi:MULTISPECIES: serine hydrolase domain-containing protein [unclassified Nonomuraea]|uniref:serine hydrolase domain-containing protein n=1 Tax=unclassified Nonomuraea TaxID=2593643 RepID=UPI0033E69303
MKIPFPSTITPTERRVHGVRQRPAFLGTAFRRVALSALAAAVFGGVATSGAAAADSRAVAKAAAGQDRPELQQAIQAFVDAGLAAGVQMRVNDERGEWIGSAGVRKLGSSAKPPTNGLFRAGSVTKNFIATVVLQLVAEGKVGLDAPVADYLPAFELDREITVRMLLQHTSGLYAYTGDFRPDGSVEPGIPAAGKEWVDNRFKSYQPEELVRFALSKEPRFEPGEGWSYSNTNYLHPP